MSQIRLGYEKVYQHALQLFGYDKDKTNAWWISKLEQLDNKSPFEWVREGKGRELIKLMVKCI